MDQGEDMAKVSVTITMERTKPSFSGDDLATVIAWIQTNITEKLPSDASAHYVVTYTP